MGGSIGGDFLGSLQGWEYGRGLVRNISYKNGFFIFLFYDIVT
jgi:hypothetical protein